MKAKNYSLRFIIILIFLFIISLLSIYSAKSISSESLGNIFLKQFLFYIIGLVFLFIGYFYKKEILKYAFFWYIGVTFLLVLLLFLGISINGSRCWLILGPISFQPSEFMKISLILIISRILCKYKKEKSLKKELLMLTAIFLIVLIPSILTFLEPDTGVVIIYFIIMLGMVLYRGINKKWFYILLSLFFISVLCLGYLYFFQQEWLLELLGNSFFYRIERVLNWSNQSGYQLENSLIAIGSSGLVGFGLNKTPLYFPEASTDFVFTTFSSNFGFLGSALLIIIIMALDISILSLCNRKVKMRDQFLLIGIFFMIFYQQIQNISMTIGLLPITGITLPFISYGGSSLLSYMLIYGMIIRISKEERRYIN